MTMITVPQIKAARGLLDWSQNDLAERTNLTQRTITGIETGKARPSFASLKLIESAFEEGGIEFIEDGVRYKKGYLTVIKGDDFGDRFVDYIYSILEKSDIKEVLLNGINQEHLPPEARAKVVEYTKKIEALGVTERFLVPETMEVQFMTGKVSQYRGLPWDYFSDTTPTFIFGDYTAVMMFDIHEVWIVKNRPYALFQRKQYELLWQTAKPFIVPNK